ncbi:MAG: glycosyltransferase, partial [Myxococcota bacterium]
MNVGGIETWIMNVLRHIDRARIQFDFLVEARDECTYEREITDAGGRLYRAPSLHRRGRVALRLAEVLRRHGPYHAFHAHGRHSMAIPVAVAAGCRIPVRIAHVHNQTDYHNATALQRTYKRATKQALLRGATWILGCSSPSLESLYGPGAPERLAKLQVLPYGIDLARFRRRDSRAAVAAEFGIPDGVKILGNVGRFAPVKRHEVMLDIFAELVRRGEPWRLLLVGDGVTRADTERKAAAMGLADKVVFTGSRADVP